MKKKADPRGVKVSVFLKPEIDHLVTIEAATRKMSKYELIAEIVEKKLRLKTKTAG